MSSSGQTIACRTGQSGHTGFPHDDFYHHFKHEYKKTDNIAVIIFNQIDTYYYRVEQEEYNTTLVKGENSKP